jgi:hypothetical protein
LKPTHILPIWVLETCIRSWRAACTDSRQTVSGRLIVLTDSPDHAGVLHRSCRVAAPAYRCRAVAHHRRKSDHCSLFMISASPNRLRALSPKRNMLRQRRFRPRQFPLHCRAATSSGLRKPAPARPRRSRCRSCIISSPTAGGWNARPAACWC